MYVTIADVYRKNQRNEKIQRSYGPTGIHILHIQFVRKMHSGHDIVCPNLIYHVEMLPLPETVGFKINNGSPTWNITIVVVTVPGRGFGIPTNIRFNTYTWWLSNPFQNICTSEIGVFPPSTLIVVVRKKENLPSHLPKLTSSDVCLVVATGNTGLSKVMLDLAEPPLPRSVSNRSVRSAVLLAGTRFAFCSALAAFNAASAAW